MTFTQNLKKFFNWASKNTRKIWQVWKKLKTWNEHFTKQQNQAK